MEGGSETHVGISDAVALLSVPGRYRARVRVSVERGRKPTFISWDARLIGATAPEMLDVRVLRSGADVANEPAREPADYDSDDPYEKMAFCNGTHPCYHEDDSSYVPVAPGEAAPELDETQTVFSECMEEMFGEFCKMIPEYHEAFMNADPADLMALCTYSRY